MKSYIIGKYWVITTPIVITMVPLIGNVVLACHSLTRLSKLITLSRKFGVCVYTKSVRVEALIKAQITSLEYTFNVDTLNG